MQVKVTVSKPGGKVGNSFSQSITFKDVGTIDELVEGVRREFASQFPRYASLEATPAKQGKSKKPE